MKIAIVKMHELWRAQILIRKQLCIPQTMLLLLFAYKIDCYLASEYNLLRFFGSGKEEWKTRQTPDK